MAQAKKPTKAPTVKRRSVAPSAPELKLSYAAAGRETLSAIEDELAAASLGTAEAPMIEISEAPAGRETMQAIAEELANEIRPRQNTLPYDDKIKNAPGARSPSRLPAPQGQEHRAGRPQVPARPQVSERQRAKPDTEPEITLTHEPAPPTPRLAPEALEIFELLTFIIRGNQVGDLSTDGLRRRFVEEHLLHRVPSGSLADVERIEVTPWTAKGTMVVRVWCKA